MAKNIVRLDIISGKPRTFVFDENLENGYFLEIIGKAKNDVLGVEADYEAYKVKKATATTKRGNLLFHASVENMYDERKLKMDFELEAGRPGRGYQPVMGDIVTLPVTMCGATVNDQGVVSGIAVGDKLKLAADGKLAKAIDSDVVIAEVEALEDIVIPMYQGQYGFNVKVTDIIQKSAVIRFREEN